MKTNNNVKDKLKMFYGLPPHDTGSNICRDDFWFMSSIHNDFSEQEIKAAMEQLKKEYPQLSRRT